MLKVLLASLVPSLAVAAQVMTLSSDTRLTAKVSQQDMSRIGVEGDRIAQVFGGSGSISIETDNTQGQIFVKPVSNSLHPISLTLITESGFTQDLLLLPLDIPAETIVLKATKKMQNQPSPINSSVLQSDIKDLVKAMVEGKEISGYEKKPASQKIQVWKDVQLTKRLQYRGAQFQGFVLELKNLSGSLLFLHEKNFFFEKGIVAVGLNCFELQPEETTLVWVVKHVP